MSPVYGVTLLEALVPTLDSSKYTYFKYYDFFGSVVHGIRFKVSWWNTIEVEHTKGNTYLHFQVLSRIGIGMSSETVPKHLTEPLMKIIEEEKKKAEEKYRLKELDREKIEKQKAMEYLVKISKDKKPSRFDY